MSWKAIVLLSPELFRCDAMLFPEGCSRGLADIDADGRLIAERGMHHKLIAQEAMGYSAAGEWAEDAWCYGCCVVAPI